MFQFPGLAFVSYVFRNKYLLLTSANPKAEPLGKPRISAGRPARIPSDAVRIETEPLE